MPGYAPDSGVRVDRPLSSDGSFARSLTAGPTSRALA